MENGAPARRSAWRLFRRPPGFRPPASGGAEKTAAAVLLPELQPENRGRTRVGPPLPGRYAPLRRQVGQAGPRSKRPARKPASDVRLPCG